MNFKSVGGRSGPTLLELVYEADVVLIQSNKTKQVYVAKNRYSNFRGDISLNSFIDLTTKMIAHQFYHGKLNMFQEGMIEELKKKITNVISEFKPKEKKRKGFYDHI
ncbi:MAG: hypothetical protein PVG65_01980 [Candidatus Thorarchaeota archaeon]|jgi:hypothetical protein